MSGNVASDQSIELSDAFPAALAVQGKTLTKHEYFEAAANALQPTAK